MLVQMVRNLSNLIKNNQFEPRVVKKQSKFVKKQSILIKTTTPGARQRPGGATRGGAVVVLIKNRGMNFSMFD